MNADENAIIYNAKVVTESGVLENAYIRLRDGKITDIGSVQGTEAFHGNGQPDLLQGGEGVRNQGTGGTRELRGEGPGGILDELWDEVLGGTQQELPTEVRIDARQGWVLPGFIDVHVHGGFGHDFMDANEEAYEAITKYHSKHGTTGIMATTVTASPEAIERVVVAADYFMDKGSPYASLLGVHLEGPFISPKWPGAQNPNYIVPAQIPWLEDWLERFPELIRIVTLAPETPGALDCIEWLDAHGIVASCGHTDASYEDIELAVSKGLKHAVHTFNAMTGLHHRKPGTAGAVLTDDRISAEVIADGHHVHFAAIKLLARMKPADRMLLITDAMSAAGLGDGEYDLGGLAVAVKDGVARLQEGGALAGSTLTMIDAFRFVVRQVGLSVAAASLMASGNPARLLGLGGVTGSLEAGKQADVLLLSEDLELQHVWVKGKRLQWD